MKADSEHWDLVIKPRIGWLEINMRDLWQYRDLMMLFVKRDFIAFYKQTILGPLWYLIQPLLSTVIFTIIFGRIASIPTDGVPHFLFYLSGLVCWNYFSDCLITTSSTFSSNTSIFGKVYFPRLVVPLSIVLSNMIKFAIQMLLFASFYVYFTLQNAGVSPTIYSLYIPLLVLQMAFLGLGFGILVSSLTTKYRDLTLLVGFGVQLWMFATPVVYPLSQVPEKFRFLYHFNPMATVITNFRVATLGVGTVDTHDSLISWCTTIVVLLLGIAIFNRVEKSFMDTV
jgi:lipopolysaccharide transport system permease protein